MGHFGPRGLRAYIDGTRNCNLSRNPSLRNDPWGDVSWSNRARTTSDILCVSLRDSHVDSPENTCSSGSQPGLCPYASHVADWPCMFLRSNLQTYTYSSLEGRLVQINHAPPNANPAVQILMCPPPRSPDPKPPNPASSKSARCSNSSKEYSTRRSLAQAERESP